MKIIQLTVDIFLFTPRPTVCILVVSLIVFALSANVETDRRTCLCL